MAGQDRGSFPALEKSLLTEGSSYSFLQAVRLLRLLLRDKGLAGGSYAEDVEGDSLRIRPELTLGFPAADIASIEKTAAPSGQERFRITATFMGMYGSSSPLPTFYTEDLLYDQLEDNTVTRDFMDILNFALYPLLVQAMLKYNIFLSVAEEQVPDDLERLFCLIGLADPGLRQEIREPWRLLRYIGLLTQYPRSALGLRTLLRDALEVPGLDIEPCVLSQVRIPDVQLNALGTRNTVLGEDAYLGHTAEDRMSKFRIVSDGLDEDGFRRLLPGGRGFSGCVFLTRFYVIESYDFELMLRPARSGLSTARLGEDKWSGLGLDTWIFSDGSAPCEPAVFYPN